MPYNPIVSRNQPFVSYCSSADCSKITADFGFPEDMPILLFQLNGGTIELSGSNALSSFGPLDITADVILNLSGQISTVAWSADVLGNGTSFLTDLSVGDNIYIEDAGVYTVLIITDDTHLTLTSMAHATAVLQYYSKVNFEYEITPSTFGWTTTYFTEGTYTFKVGFIFPSSYESGQTITESQDILVYCEKYCCVYQKLADLADICNDCLDGENTKQIVEALLMWGLLKAYCGAAACGDSVSMESLSARLNRYCNYQPCKSC